MVAVFGPGWEAGGGSPGLVTLFKRFSQNLAHQIKRSRLTRKCLDSNTFLLLYYYFSRLPSSKSVEYDSCGGLVQFSTRR